MAPKRHASKRSESFKFSLRYFLSVALLGFVLESMVPGRNSHSTVANAQLFDPGEGDLVGLDKDYMADELANKMNISDFNCPEELTNRTDPLI